MSKPYILKTYLQPNTSYSTLGIQLLSPQEQDTFSNNGNFSIHLKHINLICIENQTNNTITQDTPIFCYVQENKQTFITKLQDNELTLNINIDKNITKDEKGKIEPINTKNIFLSFIPFKDSTQANNTFSQKLQLTSTDLNKGNITKDFKIPYCKIQDCEEFGEWREEGEIPILSKVQDRKQSIIDDTPAIFNIEGYEEGIMGDIKTFLKANFLTPNILEEVAENEEWISIYSSKYNLDSDLVRAIIFLETTHGYYDKVYDIPIIQDIVTKYYDNQKSFTPMNVNYDYWKELANKMGYTKENIKNNAAANLDMGCLLLRRIIDRLENPTIEKIGTLYNALAKEKISNYGKILQKYYNDKEWYGILDYIKDNPPSTKRF